jgi:hypothetical protein
MNIRGDVSCVAYCRLVGTYRYRTAAPAGRANPIKKTTVCLVAEKSNCQVLIIIIVLQNLISNKLSILFSDYK